MKCRRLSEDWDYMFGSGHENYLTDIEAVAQVIKSRLLLLYREWWEDQEDGLPLFEKILGASGSADNLKTIDIIIRDRISGTRDVQEILSFESTFKDRRYVFHTTVSTVYGNLNIDNEGGDKFGLL